MNSDLYEGGFSLVEVLIAIAILAIVSLPILSTFTGAAKTNAKSLRIENANTVAGNVIEEIKRISVDDLDSGNLKFKYIKDGNSDSENVDGIATFLVSNNSQNTFTGNDGEDFIVEAILDPTYYSDDYENGNLNSVNNVNSYNLSSYSSLDTNNNVIYRDDTINTEATTYFMEATGDYFDKSCILKTTDFEVSVIKDTSVSDFVTYLQKVTVKLTYSYNDISGKVGEIDDYIRDYTISSKQIKASVLDKSKGTYIISTSTEYENNLEPVYMFYTIYDDYDLDANSSVGDGINVQYAKDKINITYIYDTTQNLSMSFSDLKIYLVEQDKSKIDGSIKLSSDNISVSYYADKNKTMLRNGSNKATSSDLIAYVYSNVSYWQNQIIDGLTIGNKTYIYRLIVNVYYKEKDEDNLLTSIVTTKLE